MTFLIRYIKGDDFVGTDTFTGTIDEAKAMATNGIKQRGAELAAILDQQDLDGLPKAIVHA